MVTRIYYSNGWHNIKPNDRIHSTRALRSFCLSNCLPDNLIRLQGGWYHLRQDGQLAFITKALSDLTFKQVFHIYQPSQS